MSTLTPVITDVGIAALVDAKNRGMFARITQVAVGDGQTGAGSGPYTANKGMTALKHEIQRVVVAGGEQIGSQQNQLHLTATVQDEGTNVPTIYPIYEIGFFLETGELFAIYASNGEKLAEKVAGTDFLLAFDLTFSGTDAGDIVIDGRGKLETPAARDTMLLGPNTVKIHNQKEFDQIFNRGADTVIAANSTIVLSPIQGTYEPKDTGRWQIMQDITAFADSTTSSGSKVTCTAAAHGLSNGAQISITQSTHYNGNHSVSNVTTNTFDINATFIATSTAKWGTTNYQAITQFEGDENALEAPVTCITAAAHGLGNGDSVLISQSHYYSGTFTISNVTAKSFDITARYIGSDIASGAWGGVGNNPENTFNGRPAYILKNSVVLSSNVSIIGFNQEDTLVVKDNADTKIKVQGSTSTPVTGIQLRGWSFDGRGNVDNLGGTLITDTDGAAFSLVNCAYSAFECKIVNHKSNGGKGGGIYGVSVSFISAGQLHHNQAGIGGGVYSCGQSSFTIYNCHAAVDSTVDSGGAYGCQSTLLRLFNCTAAACSDCQILDTTKGHIGIGTDGTNTTLAKLAIDGGGVHVGGASDPGDNNLLVDGNITAKGHIEFGTPQGWRLDQGSWKNANIMYNGANSSANFGFHGEQNKTVNVIVDGNVGIGDIGITSPEAPLQIAARSDQSPTKNGIYVYNRSNSARQDAIVAMRVAGSSGGNPYISWDVNNESGWSMGIDNGDANQLKISANWNSLTASTRMTITSDGKVGIGPDSTDPESELDVNGTVKAVKFEGFGVVPIGTIQAWHKNLLPKGTTLPDGWVECNGQTISDPNSLFNGQKAPNLNDGHQFLRGSSTSGDFQDSMVQKHNHEANSSVSGSHHHTGTTGWNGNHSHEGSTNKTGNHWHATWFYHANQDSGGGHTESDAKRNYKKGGYHKDTTHAGDHYHSLSIKSAGNHTHGFSTSAVGDHTHGITVNNTGGGETRPTNMSVVWIIRIK